MTGPFSKDDVITALETYGADFSLWPNHDLAQYAKSNPSFNSAVKHAAQIDAALLSYKAAPLDAAITERIMQIAVQTPQNKARIAQVLAPKPYRQAGPRLGLSRIAALIIAAFMIGFAVPYFQNESSDTALLTAELESDHAREIANDLGLADIFLWVETSETTDLNL